jgi:hypothetical protein
MLQVLSCIQMNSVTIEHYIYQCDIPRKFHQGKLQVPTFAHVNFPDTPEVRQVPFST